jgi:hypothetical protein
MPDSTSQVQILLECPSQEGKANGTGDLGLGKSADRSQPERDYDCDTREARIRGGR